jgi:uncharacterized protein
MMENRLHLWVLAVLVCLCFSVEFSLLADPWGKDADLVASQRHCPCIEMTKQKSLLAQVGICAIRFHQEVISPADGPRSHYIPSSSQYALEAISKYGFFTGVMMGCDRLMRENSDPWVYRKVTDPSGRLMKWDPVP